MRFQDGDQAMLIDSRGRRYLIRLIDGQAFHSHHGQVPHADIIGREDASRVKTHGGRELLVLKPTLADFILKMPRQAQVIYPKDIASILMYGDIYPGATVLEAGTGSGAATIALLRAASVFI